jgi:hypothetical protein
MDAIVPQEEEPERWQALLIGSRMMRGRVIPGARRL